MTTPTPDETPLADPEVQQIVYEQMQDERRRRWLLFLLLLLLLMIACVGYLFYQYITRPQPIPEMLPEVISENIYYPPVYQFSIPDVDEPMGVGVSPDGQRIYVAENGGERMIKMFDRDGNQILSFAPPGTTPANRKPAYIAVDSSGRVFVSEHYNHVIDIFTPDGEFIDAIIGKDMTLSKFVARETGSPPPPGTQFYYDNISRQVFYQLPDDEEMQSAPAPELLAWAPMGLHFDRSGNLLVTNLVEGEHSVVIIPAESLNAPLVEYSPQIQQFGTEGSGDGQLSFPNSVESDSKGNIYVSDSNNQRVSVWSPELQYQSVIGRSAAESALSMPRGLWMDSKDHLHVTDAVGQMVKVYDVSGDKPAYLYSFGDFGNGEGQFNFPSDILVDASGRVYITDQQNGQVQIWSY